MNMRLKQAIVEVFSDSNQNQYWVPLKNSPLSAMSTPEVWKIKDPNLVEQILKRQKHNLAKLMLLTVPLGLAVTASVLYLFIVPITQAYRTHYNQFFILTAIGVFAAWLLMSILADRVNAASILKFKSENKIELANPSYLQVDFDSQTKMMKVNLFPSSLLLFGLLYFLEGGLLLRAFLPVVLIFFIKDLLAFVRFSRLRSALRS